MNHMTPAAAVIKPTIFGGACEAVRGESGIQGILLRRGIVLRIGKLREGLRNCQHGGNDAQKADAQASHNENDRTNR